MSKLWYRGWHDWRYDRDKFWYGNTQRGQEAGDVGETVSALFRHCPQNGALNRARHQQIELRGRNRSLGHVFVAKREEIGCAKGQPTCYQLVSDAAERVLIALFTDGAAKLLRGHVGGSANGGTMFAAVCQHCRDAKIGQQGIAVGMKKYIGGFEVAMDDILLVCILQRLSNLPQDI